MDHNSALPSLDALQSVLAAHRTGSFTRAADELRLTHGAVSRRVGAVERWAGVTLFERHGRGVRLTVEGQRLVGLVEHALATIAAGSAQWSRRRTLDVVRVSVLPSFARLWLLPNLERLEGSPPDLRIDLEIDHRFSPLESVDVAIRYGRGGWREGVATRLFAETLVPVASPGIAAELGEAPSIAALLGYPLIHDTFPDAWRTWLSHQDQSYRLRAQDRVLPDYDLALHAAAAGAGIALLRSPYGAEFVASGRLVPVHRGRAANPASFYAVTQGSAKRKRVDVLLERLIALEQPPGI